MLVVGSAFRNNTGVYLDRYFSRLRNLQVTGTPFRLVMVEGDSVDRTREELQHRAAALDVPWQLVTRNHGGPMYGSTEQPERMSALSFVGNGFMEAVGDGDDVAVYVESDLIWEADTILRLVAQLKEGEIDVIAPLVFAGEAFYDIWAFRNAGVRFGPFYPHHHTLRFDVPTEVESVGSCLVMRAEVARNVRMSTYALVEFCDNARVRGYRVWVDARERIWHP